MKNRMARRTGAAALAALTLSGLAACSPGAKTDNVASKASSATSAKDLGGMASLVDAAKKEGKLNLSGLPSGWNTPGGVIHGFQAKYGLAVNRAQPDATNAEQVAAAKSLKGRPDAPDVFNLDNAVAGGDIATFAAYKVADFDNVPAGLREANGLRVGVYGGYLSIGYDPAKVPAPKTMTDLLKPVYKGKIALNGDPSKGLAVLRTIQAAGNLRSVDPNSTTVVSGQTPVVLDWDYLNVAQGRLLKGKVRWVTVIPAKAVVGGYQWQAISRGAPHPAAARLWAEYVLSDEGQNLWLKGGAHPVREARMVASGTIDKAAFKALPKVAGTPVVRTN